VGAKGDAELCLEVIWTYAILRAIYGISGDDYASNQ
jgi:hypothetical protein